MQALLFPVVVWVLGSAVARLLAGAGLALGTYAVLEPLIAQFASAAAAQLGGLAPEIAALLWIAGAGDAMTLILSALLARAALQSAMIFIGKAG